MIGLLKFYFDKNMIEYFKLYNSGKDDRDEI